MGLFNTSEKNKPKVVKAKCLGITRGEESKVLGNVNFAVYSFLLEYEDGHREIKEYSNDSKKDAEELLKILPYIPM